MTKVDMLNATKRCINLLEYMNVGSVKNAINLMMQLANVYFSYQCTLSQQYMKEVCMEYHKSAISLTIKYLRAKNGKES